MFRVRVYLFVSHAKLYKIGSADSVSPAVSTDRRARPLSSRHLISQFCAYWDVLIFVDYISFIDTSPFQGARRSTQPKTNRQMVP